MNKAKKLLAICLCVAMICAMSVTAFAAPAADGYPGPDTPDARPENVKTAEDTTNGKAATVDVTEAQTNDKDGAISGTVTEGTAVDKIAEILDVAGDQDATGNTDADGTDVGTKTHGVSLTPAQYNADGAKDFDDTNELSAEDKSGISPIMLETSGLYFSVTVPTVLPVYVNEQNQHFEAKNVSIINNSYGPVKVTAARVSEKGSWKLAAYDEAALDKEKVNTPVYGMMIDGKEVAATDAAIEDVTLGTELSKVMAPSSVTDKSNVLTFGYQVKTAPQAKEIDRDHAATLGNVVFTLAWDAYVAPTGD